MPSQAPSPCAVTKKCHSAFIFKSFSRYNKSSKLNRLHYLRVHFSRTLNKLLEIWRWSRVSVRIRFQRPGKSSHVNFNGNWMHCYRSHLPYWIPHLILWENNLEFVSNNPKNPLMSILVTIEWLFTKNISHIASAILFYAKITSNSFSATQKTLRCEF